MLKVGQNWIEDLDVSVPEAASVHLNKLLLLNRPKKKSRPKSSSSTGLHVLYSVLNGHSTIKMRRKIVKCSYNTTKIVKCAYNKTNVQITSKNVFYLFALKILKLYEHFHGQKSA